ncbi:MAG TPA: aquaporin [Gaiellaceae bacterium]|nr:aquaporin [Gaiellaceae bacterium]
MNQWQKYVAELFGTFILVFVGTVSVAGALRAGADPLLVAPFAFGLALLAGLYAFGEVSGGHFNPAVSLGMFLDGRLARSELVAYWIAQFVGGVLAALVLLLATTKDEVAATATIPSSNGTALVIEIAMTAIFVAVILQASRSGTYGGTALIAIPLTLLAIHFAAIPFSGSSVNPARTFGPDLIGNKWTGFWVYLVGPALGAAVGWAAHALAVKGQTSFSRAEHAHPAATTPA